MSDARLSIAIADILVPEDRLRPVDGGAALALSRLIQQEGQKSPIAVYRSNATGKPYTLIYGARRLRALEILGAAEIEVVLRTKAEARMLEITDNLVMPALDALEQAEYVTAYRHWWETEFGPVERGGNRAKRNDFALKSNFELSEKPNFYKDISDKFALSERTAQYLFKIGRLSPTLREAIRGTSYAKDQKYLKKLTKFTPEQQSSITAALHHNPDLDTILRIGDPATGREGVGRMETQDWRESQFLDGWQGMTPERRAAALEKLGLMERPLNPWPSHIPPVRPVLPSPKDCPVMAMMRDPYRRLSAIPTIDEIETAKAEQAEEERLTLYLERQDYAGRINDVEKERRADYEKQIAKAKAAKSRKSKRGRRPDSDEVKLSKSMIKDGVIPELATALIEKLLVKRDFWIVKAAPRLTPDNQYIALHWIDQGHDLEEVAYRVMKMLEQQEKDEQETES